MEMQELLDKYFKDKKTCYFQSSDAHKNIEGDTYLTYTKSGDRIELYIGGDNGEVCLCVTDKVEKLETLITNIIR